MDILNGNKAMLQTKGESLKTINLLVTNNAIASASLGLVDMVQFTNQLWFGLYPHHKTPLLQATMYVLDGNSFSCSNGIQIPATNIADYQPGDMVIMSPAYVYDKTRMGEYLATTSRFHSLLEQESKRGAILSAYCSATFALAHTGMLNGRSATTVWWMRNLFANYFPQVSLNFSDLVVESDHFLTGGPTTSVGNVFLRVVEKFSSARFASQVSKLFLLDRNRLSQHAFMDSSIMVNPKDALVDDIQDWMFEHYREDISLDLICEKFAVTKRTLNRRFKASCQETPLNYLQRIRVEKAKQFLETTDLPVETIVEKVGYQDPASFRKLFTAQTQLTPKIYRQRFSYAPET